MELLLEKDGLEPIDDNNVRIRSGLTQVNHVRILGIVVPGFGLLQRRELQKKKDAGQCTLPFKALHSGPSPGKNFPPYFCTKAPAFGPYSFCQFVFFTSSCATIYAAMCPSSCRVRKCLSLD